MMSPNYDFIKFNISLLIAFSLSLSLTHTHTHTNVNSMCHTLHLPVNTDRLLCQVEKETTMTFSWGMEKRLGPQAPFPESEQL